MDQEDIVVLVFAALIFFGVPLALQQCDQAAQPPPNGCEEWR